MAFESILDVPSCALRVPEEAAGWLPDILLAVPEARRWQMQLSLARLWQW